MESHLKVWSVIKITESRVEYVNILGHKAGKIRNTAWDGVDMYWKELVNISEKRNLRLDLSEAGGIEQD